MKEKLSLIDEAHELGVRHISLTGGEVLVLEELELILRKIRECDMSVSMVTNGILLDRKRAKLLDHYEVYPIVSLDGAKRETHELIRGVGTWERVLNALKILKTEGIGFSTIMAINKLNYKEAGKYVELASSEGAITANLIPTMPSGRADERIVPRANEIVSVIKSVSEIAASLKYHVNLWCTPFSPLVSRSPYVRGWGCRTLSVVDIDPSGRILLCDVLDFVLGDIRKGGLLRALEEYQSSPLLNAVVNPELKSPCITCPLRNLCRGGCFARAYLILKDLKAPDPLCPRVATQTPS